MLQFALTIVLLSSLVTIATSGKTKLTNSITNLDLKHEDGSSSYCASNKCKIPVNAKVKIVFTLNVASEVSDLFFTARIGKSEKKKVFDNYYACSSGGKVTLQSGSCTNTKIAVGTYNVAVTVVLSKYKANGKFVIGDRTQKFVSNPRLSVTIA